MVVSTSTKGPGTRKTKKADIRRTAVVVLGMHRSGTSALTRVLSLLGCDLPKTLMQASANNEAGHWESDAIYRFNGRILESAGSAWHDWTEFNPGWIDSPKAGQFKDEAIELIEDEFGGSRLFVFKDPRTCRLLPFWRDVFVNCEVRPLALLPIRNPLEVAASLEKRDGFEPALGHLLWLRHVLDAEAASRDIPRVFSTYDQLMQSWGRVAENAQNALDIRWPRLSDRSAAEIDNYLDERLRHHQKLPESVVDNPGLSAWLRETYAIMQSWAETGEKSGDRPVLDRIRGELNAAAPAFARLIAVGRSARQKAANLEKALSEEAAKLVAAQASVVSAERTATKVTEELVRQRERASQLDEEAVGLRARVAEGERVLATLRSELEGQSAAAEEAGRALGELRARLSVTESTLAQRQLETEQTSAELAAARGEMEQARKQRAENEKVVAGLKEHVSLLLADAHERNVLAAELAEARREIDQAKAATAEIEQLNRKLAAAEERRREEKAELEGTLRAEAEKKMRLALAREMGRTVSALLDGNAGRLLPNRIRVLRKMALLKRSGLFDAEWYRGRYADVAESGIDPLKHYVAHGAQEGREPNSILAEHTNVATG